MIFQYQQKAEPLVEIAPPPPPEQWYPSYPDRVPHRRSILAPFLADAPFIAPSTQPLRVSQLPGEVAFQYGSVLTRASQLPVETVFQYAVNIRWTRVSQAAVEIIYPFGCYIYVPPLPNPCPAPADDPTAGVTCTAPAPTDGGS